MTETVKKPMVNIGLNKVLKTKIVVDPRSGQLFLKKAAHKALKAGKKATKVLVPVVLAKSFLGGADVLKTKIVVDPRSGQLFLISAAHKALKAGHKATKGLAPVVFATSFLGGAGAAAIPGAVVGGIAGNAAGALRTRLLGGATVIPSAVVGGTAGEPTRASNTGATAGEPTRASNTGATAIQSAVASLLERAKAIQSAAAGDIRGIADLVDAEDREQQANAVVIDGNGNALLVNTDVTGSNIEVDTRSGQSLPKPVVWAALKVVRAGAHLVPYAAVPLAIVGGTLGAKAVLAKKLIKLLPLAGAGKIGGAAGGGRLISGLISDLSELDSAASGGRGININAGFGFNSGNEDPDVEDNADEDDDSLATNPQIVQAISYPTPVATKSLNKYGVVYDRNGQLHLKMAKNSDKKKKQSLRGGHLADPRTGQLILAGGNVDTDGRFQLSALNGVGGNGNLVSLIPGLHNTQLPVANLVDLNTAFDGAQLMIAGTGNLVNVNTGLDDSRVGQNADLVFEDFQADARTGQSYRASASRF